MRLHRTGPVRTSRSWLAIAFLAMLACDAQAIILHPQDDPPTGLITPPVDVVGRWGNNASCVAIDPNHIITTRHQYGGVGTTVVFGGVSYKVAAEVAYPTDTFNRSADFRVCRITTLAGGAANLGAYAGMYTSTNERYQTVTMGGYGVTRGADLVSNGITYGYSWSGWGTTTLHYGCNTVDSFGSTTLGFSGGLTLNTNALFADFDGPDQPGYVQYEAGIGVWDSGGGWFAQSGGSWKVLGLMQTAEHASSNPTLGQTWFRSASNPQIPDPDQLGAVRVSSYASWASSMLQTQQALWVPGDADHSGSVNDNDMGTLLANWGTGTTWAQGNFKGSGVVNDNDLGVLLNNWGGNVAPAAVPEPATAAVLVLGAVAAMRRRSLANPERTRRHSMLKIGRIGWTLAAAAILFPIVIAAVAEPTTQPAPKTTTQPAPKTTDWCQYLGVGQDNKSNQKIATTFPSGGPKKLWTRNLGAGYSSFTVWKNQVFTMGNTKDEDTVWCFDAASGDIVWETSYACKPGPAKYPGPRCTPAVDGENVFVLGQDGQLHCLGINNGAPKWSKDVVKDYGAEKPFWAFSNSPALLGDMILLDLGKTVAIKKADGEKVWESDKHTISYSTPKVFSLDGKLAVAAFPGDCLQVLNAADGKEISKYPWKTTYDTTPMMPVVSDGMIFISTGYGIGCAVVEAATGKEVWKNKELCLHASNPVLHDGHLYAVSGDFGGDGQLKCVEFKTGKLKWSQKGFAVGSQTLAGDKIIVLDGKGNVTIVQATPESYKELAKFKAIDGSCWTMPVLAGGRLFVRNNKPGDMACLDLTPEK